MKPWIGIAAALYPRNWREQYGEEFRALLDDVKPGWRIFANVLGGALKMQITSGTGWLKLAAATAVAGAIVAAAASFAVAPHYVSSAVMQVVPQADPLRPTSPQALQQRAADRVVQMQTDILSRGSLAQLIQKPSLDLYKRERQRMPMEDVVQEMRRHIRIQAHSSVEGGMAPIVLSISFEYPDQVKAQAVLRELVTKFAEQNFTINRFRDALYRAFWKDEAAAHQAKPAPPPPVGEIVVVLDPPSLPNKPMWPNRIAFLAWGLGSGLLLGLLAGLARRQPRRVWQVAGFAAAGCVLAGAASFLIPDRYTSTAVMRITSAQITEDPLATAPAAPTATGILGQMAPGILSFESLSAIIQKPRLNLYPEERAKKPMEDVVRNMLARDLRIIALNPGSGSSGAVSAFTISFSYSDRYKAQAVVREFVTAFTEQNVLRARANASQMSATLRDIHMHKAGENLEVLDPASFPEAPASPNRPIIALLGLAVGLLLGALTLRLRQPRTPAMQAA
jgi:uncharacterized protein involved in exopolysaccharide biosynthesis